ncbi:ParB/RepB/Spo0J family partition protein [Sphingobium fuliginis]|nr:ParB/RepB/Spo0J family partition protein [Sphingobium fuliginis]
MTMIEETDTQAQLFPGQSLASWEKPEDDDSIHTIHPSQCVAWAGNARHAQEFCPRRSAELIDSIAREGQRMPIIVRRSSEGAGHYEIIAGMRRHAAVGLLLAKGLDVQLKARIISVDDEEAWRISEAENAGRQDVTPLQRARSWAWAMERFHLGRQDRLAAAVGKDVATVSRTLSLLNVPQEILDVLLDPEAMSINFASKLQARLSDDTQREAALTRAKQIRELELRLAGPKLLEELFLATEQLNAQTIFDLDDVLEIAKVRLTRKADRTLSLRVKPLTQDLTKRERTALLRSIEKALSSALDS